MRALEGDVNECLLEAGGRPATCAYLGQRLVVRREANARELEQEKLDKKVHVGSLTAVKFVETREIIHCHRRPFNVDGVLPGKNVTYFEPFPDEDRLHCSHPRIQRKVENARALPRHRDYQEPWIAVGGSHVLRWE